MTVHNHGIDPSCKERTVGECLLGKDVVHLRLVGTPEHTVKVLRELLDRTGPYGRAIIEPLARQIEAQTKPPRIPDPGVWGVVSDKHGYYWTSSLKGRWVRLNDGVDWPWCDIEDPVLVREGV